MDPGAEAFYLNSVVRGHHIYKDIWSSVHGEELYCRREFGNVHDLYAVSVIKQGTGIIGHLPKRISTPCHLFLKKGGVFHAKLMDGAITHLTYLKVVLRYLAV